MVFRHFSSLLHNFTKFFYLLLRYSNGVIPYILLNVLLKYLASWYPTISATSDTLYSTWLSHPVPISSRTGLSLPGQLFPVHGSLPALVQLFLNALQHRNQFPWIGGF